MSSVNDRFRTDADTHRGVGNGDLKHLQAVSEKQHGWLMMVVGAVTGEVEAGGVVAAGLDAERVRDADVAASPGAAIITAQKPSGCWCCSATKRREHQQQHRY